MQSPEYGDDKLVAEEFRDAVDSVLEAEGLVISVVGGRSVLGELGPDDAAHYGARSASPRKHSR